MHTLPESGFTLKAGDIVFITGRKEDISRAIAYLTSGKIL